MPMPHRTKCFPVSLRRAMTSTMELGGKVDGRIERRADEPFFAVPDQAFKQNCQVLLYP
jgi:hypothetical protein